MKILKRLLAVFFIMFCLTLPVHAATAMINQCQIVSSDSVQIKVTIPDTSEIVGKKCYLFSIPTNKVSLGAGMKPIASAVKKSTMTFYVPLNKTSAESNLYRKFALAERKSNGAYHMISNCAIISNPQKIAKYTYKFPVASSKKGLQVSVSMQEDAVELNVKHSVLNINFATLISAGWEENPNKSIPYRYHGKTYWFRKNVVEDYDRQLKALKETNCIVSGILLLSWREDLKNMIPASGRVEGHPYYAWNTAPGAGREKLQATISFLAERYSPSNGKYGRIVNWIVGNEVNNYNVYNYAGKRSLSSYANLYAQAFLMTYQTVTSIYSNARVYISLDHLWNTKTIPGIFSSRSMLDSFAKKLSSYGEVKWNLAYHPYSSPLTDPKFWTNPNGQLTGALTSPVINMGNIGLLTSYIKKRYGSGCRIILSEQGYTSAQAGKDVAKEQAAAIAYSYFLTEADDQIDSFIMNRHVDHDVEVAQGLNLGLWTTKNPSHPEWANKKKYAWNVFKYMDSNQSEKYTSFALEQIGIASWNQVIKNYNPSLYTKYQIANGKIQQGPYTEKAGLPAKWKKYGAAVSGSVSGNTYRALWDFSRNRHCLWGFTQKFTQKLSFKDGKRFCTTIQAVGSTRSQVQVLIRFYSGSRVYECRQNIPSGVEVPVSVSLKNWAYADKVSKIQVLVCTTAPSANWKNGAYLEMKNTVIG